MPKYYCDFYISSNKNDAVYEVFSSKTKRDFNFIDNLSENRIKMKKRLRHAGLSEFPSLRYRWITSSNGNVDGPEVIEHIKSITSDFLIDVDFKKIKKEGGEFGFSFYWEGRGTGGGPVINPELSEILAYYGITLEFGFNYCE